jgi:hypothetical protein
MYWPAGMTPAESALFVHNEILIAAPAERIWGWLIRAERWPTWYSNSAEVKIVSDGPDLCAGARFQWRTFGVHLQSHVLIFDPPRAIGWDAVGPLRPYHGWRLEPDGARCRVVTEETQNGLLPRFLRWWLRPKLLRGHQLWLESLKRMAQSGDPL